MFYILAVLWVLTELEAEMPGNISIFLIICQFCGRNQNAHCTARVSDDGILLVVWWLLMGPIWNVESTGDVTHPCTWPHKERTAVLQAELCGQVDCRQCHWWSQGRHAQWGLHLGTEKRQIFYLCVGEDLQNAENINSDTVSPAAGTRLHCMKRAGFFQR